MIIGNLNLRLKTIFFLLENCITDGVYPLQRSFYELQVAFKTFADAENHAEFVNCYQTKKYFETTFKFDKLINLSSSNVNQDFTTEEKRKIAEYKNNFKKKIEEENSIKGNGSFKAWFEIASGSNFKTLSDHYYTEKDYFTNYDEPSNWVHPQRLEENLSTVDFNQYLPDNYLKMLLNDLIWDINELTEDMLYLVKHFKICKSKPFFLYGQQLDEFQKSLVSLLKKLTMKKEEVRSCLLLKIIMNKRLLNYFGMN